MVELELKVFPSGPILTNNYLVFNKQSRKAFIVDFASSRSLSGFIEEEGLKVEFIALTHAHFDHISGLKNNSFPFYLHRCDRDLLADPDKNGSFLFAEALRIDKKPLLYGRHLDFAGRKIEVIHTPGHTPGSVSLRLDNWLFSGDALFRESIGRTDIPLGSSELLLRSIREKILVLPGETKIYPGHGPSSEIRHERENNPFL